MHSGPKDIFQKTEAVFTGTFRQGPQNTAFVDVHDVIWQRGAALKGRKRVQVSYGKLHYGLDVADGVTAVFFLGTLDELVYIAEPAKPVPLQFLGGLPLNMRGFYAFNAHLTTPSMVTLEGIKQAFKTKTFKERFKISVAFPSAAGLSADPGLTFTGEVVDGSVAPLKGPIGGSIQDANVSFSSWNHSVTLNLGGKGTRTELMGRFERVEQGVLVGVVVSGGPVLNAISLKQWLKTGRSALNVTVSMGKRQATLALTGEAEGSLGPGLGAEGSLARIGRFDGNGYYNQYGKGPTVDPSTHGWHLEIATSAGPLWITLPLSTVDQAAGPLLRRAASLQAQVLTALVSGDQPVVFSGALQGTGILSLNP